MWSSDNDDHWQQQQQRQQLSDVAGKRFAPDEPTSAENPTQSSGSPADDERERELKLRRTRPPTRRRNDTNWDLYVCNFPYDTTEEDLQELFKRFKCLKVRLVDRPEKPFAFVPFADFEHMASAWSELDNTDFNGRKLKASVAHSSMVTEDFYHRNRERSRFPVHVVTSDTDDDRMNRGRENSDRRPAQCDRTVRHRTGSLTQDVGEGVRRQNDNDDRLLGCNWSRYRDTGDKDDDDDDDDDDNWGIGRGGVHRPSYRNTHGSIQRGDHQNDGETREIGQRVRHQTDRNDHLFGGCLNGDQPNRSRNSQNGNDDGEGARLFRPTTPLNRQSVDSKSGNRFPIEVSKGTDTDDEFSGGESVNENVRRHWNNSAQQQSLLSVSARQEVSGTTDTDDDDDDISVEESVLDAVRRRWSRSAQQKSLLTDSTHHESRSFISQSSKAGTESMSKVGQESPSSVSRASQLGPASVSRVGQKSPSSVSKVGHERLSSESVSRVSQRSPSSVVSRVGQGSLSPVSGVGQDDPPSMLRVDQKNPSSVSKVGQECISSESVSRVGQKSASSVLRAVQGTGVGQEDSPSMLGENQQGPSSVSRVAQDCPSVSRVRLDGHLPTRISGIVALSPAETVINTVCEIDCSGGSKPGGKSAWPSASGTTSHFADNSCSTSAVSQTSVPLDNRIVSDDGLERSTKFVPDGCTKTMQIQVKTDDESLSSKSTSNRTSSIMVGAHGDDWLSRSSSVGSSTLAPTKSLSTITSDEEASAATRTLYNSVIAEASDPRPESRRPSSNRTLIYSRSRPFSLWIKVYSREDCDDLGQVFVRFATDPMLPVGTVTQSRPLSSSQHSSLEPRVMSGTEYNSGTRMVDVSDRSPCCDGRPMPDADQSELTSPASTDSAASSLCVSRAGSSIGSTVPSTLKLTMTSASAVLKSPPTTNRVAQGLSLNSIASADSVRSSPTNNLHSSIVSSRSSLSSVAVSSSSGSSKSPIQVKIGRLPKSMETDFLDRAYHVTCSPSHAVRSVLQTSTESEGDLSIFVTHVDDLQHFWGHVGTDRFQASYNLRKMMSRLYEDRDRLASATGDCVRAGATYEEENELYRVFVVEPHNEAWRNVFYIDYGNFDKVRASSLQVLPDEVWDTAPVATPFCYIVGNQSRVDLRGLINTEVRARVAPHQQLYKNQSRYMILLNDVGPLGRPI